MKLRRQKEIKKFPGKNKLWSDKIFRTLVSLEKKLTIVYKLETKFVVLRTLGLV